MLVNSNADTLFLIEQKLKRHQSTMDYYNILGAEY